MANIFDQAFGLWMWAHVDDHVWDTKKSVMLHTVSQLIYCVLVIG